jgi:hypothetical protein
MFIYYSKLTECTQSPGTPGMGVNLWGESPLYVNPVKILNILANVLGDGKGVAPHAVRCAL